MTHKNVIKSLPITELFFLMATNETNSTMSLRAHNELMDRYTNEFSKICKDVCRKNNFEKIRDLDEEVLRISKSEIYLKSKSFELPKKKTSKISQEKFLIGWFGNIAEKVLENIILENNHFEKKHNLVPDFHQHLAHIKSFQKSKEEADEEEKLLNDREEEKLVKLRILERAMKRLKPKEREVLIEYKKLKNGNKNLSKDRIDYLCRRWKTNHANLLQIKLRATKKLHRLFLDEQKKEDSQTDTSHTGGTSL